MTVFASDTFTRPDAAVLGNAEVGGAWAFADWGISNNRARRGAGSVNATLAVAPTGDYFCEVDAVLADYVSGSQLFGIDIRYLDDNNLVLLERVLVPGSEDAVKLYVAIANNYVERDIWGGGPGATGLDPNAQLDLRVEVDGLNLACFVNGVERLNYTLSGAEDAALGTGVGMRSEGNHNPLFDNFLVETLAAFDPIVSGTGSINDQIMAGLISQGFTTGSIADRERARLLSKLGFSSTVTGYSLYDLYRAASEEPRIF